MTVEKLERTMMRIRRENPGKNIITNSQLRKAIMKEIGTDKRTICSNRRALIDLGWIKTVGPQTISLTNEDLSGDF